LGTVAKRVHSFWKRLEEAQRWEGRVSEDVADMLVVEAVKRASRQEQKDGIDIIIQLKRGTFDVKFRDYKYYGKGILIETVSVIEEGVPGWFYTSKADSVVYFWWNPERTSLIPLACFVNIQDKRLREWFEENKHKLPTYRAETEKDGRLYHTEFVIVPEREFPKGTIKWIPFRPMLVQEQLKLNVFIRSQNPPEEEKLGGHYEGD